MTHESKTKRQSSEDKNGARFPGDRWLSDFRCVSVATVSANPPVSPARLWPWVAQLGRGGGYYVWDRVINGGRPSADYPLETPPPLPGDSNGLMGTILETQTGENIVWGARSINVFFHRIGYTLAYVISGSGGGCELTIRFRAGADGVLAGAASSFLALAGRALISSQLKNIMRLVGGYPLRRAARGFNAGRAPLGHQNPTYSLSHRPEAIPSARETDPE